MVNKKRLVKTFLKLASLDSPSGHEKEALSFVEMYLSQCGLKSKYDKYGNLICHTKVRNNPKILAAHIDTVVSNKNLNIKINGDEIQTNKKTILGADPKTGIAIILESIKSLSEEKKNFEVECIFTKEEEVGLVGVKNFDFSLLRGKRGVILNELGPITNIVIQNIGLTLFEGEIVGKSSHSSEPEKGIHPIKVFLDVFKDIKLGYTDKDKDTLINVGVIKGGETMNSIPESIFIKGEIRGFNQNKINKLAQQIKTKLTASCKKYKAKNQVKFTNMFKGLKFLKNDKEINKIAQVMKQLSLKPKYVKVPGASDVNIYIQKGLKIISLGSAAYNPHSNNEWASIREMNEGVRFLKSYLLQG